MNCADFELVASEFALGLLDGQERARAVAHLDQCPACRQLADELAQAADSLTLVAPAAEPPAGFETRVLARLDGAAVTTARPWWRRPLVAAAALVLVAAAIVGVVRLRDDADGGTATGSAHHWAVGTMMTPDGEEVGLVLVGDDPTGFVHLRVNRWNKPGVDYYVELDFEDGVSERVELIRLESGGFNAALPERGVRLTGVSMVKDDGTVLCHGDVDY